MGLSLPLPKRILTHAHWTLSHAKMSKSSGNAVNPFFAIDRFGTDVIRFYLALEGRIKDDSNYDNYTIISRYKHALRGLLGNLVSRVTRHKGWNARDAVRQAEETGLVGMPDSVRQLDALAGAADSHMEQMNPGEALQIIIDQIGVV
jgi:methionyl-tRNA synthetase